jgi:hypothetical protein
MNNPMVSDKVAVWATSIMVLVCVALEGFAQWGKSLSLSHFGERLTATQSFAVSLSAYTFPLLILCGVSIIALVGLLVFRVVGQPVNRRTIGVCAAMVLLFPFSLVLFALPAISSKLSFARLVEMREIGWIVPLIVVVMMIAGYVLIIVVGQ